MATHQNAAACGEKDSTAVHCPLWRQVQEEARAMASTVKFSSLAFMNRQGCNRSVGFARASHDALIKFNPCIGVNSVRRLEPGGWLVLSVRQREWGIHDKLRSQYVRISPDGGIGVPTVRSHGPKSLERLRSSQHIHIGFAEFSRS